MTVAESFSRTSDNVRMRRLATDPVRLDGRKLAFVERKLFWMISREKMTRLKFVWDSIDRSTYKNFLENHI